MYWGCRGQRNLQQVHKTEKDSTGLLQKVSGSVKNEIRDIWGEERAIEMEFFPDTAFCFPVDSLVRLPVRKITVKKKMIREHEEQAENRVSVSHAETEIRNAEETKLSEKSKPACNYWFYGLCLVVIVAVIIYWRFRRGSR